MFSKIAKIIAITFSVVLLSSVGLMIYGGYTFYKSVFRLSFEQTNSSLEKIEPQCVKFSECKLQPGDIIVRRYITMVTDLFSKTLNPYFTHSAIYLGDDELFEALGNYLEPEDQIQITKLSESDWMKGDMKNFAIIRPKNLGDKFPKIDLNLREIANNPDYIFGLLDETKKTASCSDVILKELIDKKVVVNLSNQPWVITPDYLFWITLNDKSNFEIVGYSVNSK